MDTKLAYSLQEAADATGLSIDTIRRAMRAGDLAVTYPRVNGRPISKPLVARSELERWTNDDP